MSQSKVIKLDAHRPDLKKIKEAARLVDAGKLVAFPTETVYGIACRIQNDSMARLDSLKGRDPTKHYTLHISQKADLSKYVPTIGLRSQKLIKNAWPGPLTIVFELTDEDIDKQRTIFERGVFENLYKNNSIGIRCPENSIASMLLGSVNNPVIAPSANIGGQDPAVDAEQVFAQFPHQLDLILDGGPCKYNKSSSVVKIGKKGVNILRAGVYPQEEVLELSEVKILFVCTGNTCRSPMAEGIFQKYLVEKLGVDVDHLSEVGYKVRSAGTLGVSGLPASVEAVSACAKRGVDIRGHRSSTLSRELVRESDFVFAMSNSHREQVIALDPEAADKCVLLVDGKDVLDPIGQPLDVYAGCADLIEAAIKEKFDRFVL